MRAASPLRYPGGKWRLSPFFERLIALNDLSSRAYAEPYAGGGSLALSLLFKGLVSEIHLNDLDPAVYAFWWSVTRRTNALLELMRSAPLTVQEWERQRLIYRRGPSAGRLALGFATFFLNRTNHSGIMNGGVIGGKEQNGEWKLDARFNKPELERRILAIAKLRNKIHLYCQDAVDFLSCKPFGKRALVYLDPPYYEHGNTLYLNAYTRNDHEEVHRAVSRSRLHWVVSYDAVSPIRQLYRRVASRRVWLLHTARSVHAGAEIMFFSDGLRIPRLSPSSATRR
jgi:DNA adenine methylase